MTKAGLPIMAFVLGLIIGGSLMARSVQRPAVANGSAVTGIGGVFF